MLNLGAHGGAGFVGAIGFYIAAYSIACVVFVLLLYPMLAIAARCRCRRSRARRCPDSRSRSRRARRSRRCRRWCGAPKTAAAAQGRHWLRAAAGGVEYSSSPRRCRGRSGRCSSPGLSDPARTDGLPDDCLHDRLPLIRRSGCAARSLPDAGADVPVDWSAARGHRHSDCRRRSSRRLRDGAQRDRGSGRGRSRCRSEALNREIGVEGRDRTRTD